MADRPMSRSQVHRRAHLARYLVGSPALMPLSGVTHRGVNLVNCDITNYVLTRIIFNVS